MWIMAIKAAASSEKRQAHAMEWRLRVCAVHVNGKSFGAVSAIISTFVIIGGTTTSCMRKWSMFTSHDCHRFLFLYRNKYALYRNFCCCCCCSVPLTKSSTIIFLISLLLSVVIFETVHSTAAGYVRSIYLETNLYAMHFFCFCTSVAEHLKSHRRHP